MSKVSIAKTRQYVAFLPLMNPTPPQSTSNNSFPYIRPTNALPVCENVSVTMATEGLRRSTRVSKPVRSYGDEQAEEEELALSKPPSEAKPKGKRQPQVQVKRESSEAEDAADEDFELSEPSPKRKRKGEEVPQSQKDARTTRILENAAKHAEQYDQHVKTKQKAKTGTGKDWHADAADTRIAAKKRKIEKLRPGQQETRLRR